MTEPSDEEWAALRELVDAVNFAGISYYRQSVEVAADFEGDTREVLASEELQHYFNLRLRNVDNRLGVRVMVTIESTVGTVVIDASADYEAESEISPSRETQFRFANDVAIMALWPYLRQSVWDLTQKVYGVPVILPMLQRGELTFSPDPETSPASE